MHPSTKLALAVALSIGSTGAFAIELPKDGDKAEVILVLPARAQAKDSPPDAGGDYLARRRALVASLRSHADATQAPLRRWLEARHIAYRSYWIANLVVASLDARQIKALAERPDISRIELNSPLPRRELPDAVPGERKLEAAGSGVAWGIELIGAPDVWATGTRGEGVVVAGQDTGYQWNHAALRESYRGWNETSVDHDYNWHDAITDADRVPDNSFNPCPNRSKQPCDDNGHGTHTMGTIVGEDGDGRRVGVAPDARWIGCRNMDQGAGTPVRYIDCMQWLLAPTDTDGANPNPDLAPDVINNSWACDAAEGCVLGNELEDAVDTLVDAGIFFAAAAGNGGDACSTIIHAPATYPSAFVVGASNEADQLSAFSSRGPVAGSPLNRPDLVAPGELVESSVPPVAGVGDYAMLSGTSMATPHVAGVAALLMSVNPTLKGRPHETASILLQSASTATIANPLSFQRCGNLSSSAWPNPMLGAGRLDALAAVRLTVAKDVDATGAWYDPAQSGHGLILESLGGDRFSAWWFTFDDAGRQLWFGGVGTRAGAKFKVAVNRVQGAGARFAPDFDASRTASIPVGTLDFTFDHCNRGHVAYALDIDGQQRTGTMPLKRLTLPTGAPCDVQSGAIQPATAPVGEAAANLTGAWYDPAQSGQGLVVQSLGGNKLLAWWFTFTPAGEPAWFGGIADVAGNVAQIDVVRTSGGRFPPAFDAQAVSNPAIGTLRLSFADCASGRVEFDLAQGFGKGSMPLRRLTRPVNAHCTTGTQRIAP